jgi:hypothetical protein
LVAVGDVRWGVWKVLIFSGCGVRAPVGVLHIIRFDALVVV